MTKVIVTGAGGFLGRHCLPLLQASFDEVHAVSSKEIQATDSHVHWHAVDLLDPKQTRDLLADIRATHLLHLAWYTVPGKYWTATENLEWLRASLSLLRVFAERGGQRVVGVGTCAEYDWQDGFCSESTTALAPATLYGACKHALQLVTAAYARQTGLSAAWGRLFFPYGPYERPERFIPSVICSLLANEPARMSHGNQRRDFVFVEDAAAALVSLLQSNVSGPVNIASGEAVTLREIAYKIGELLDRSELIKPGTIEAMPNDPPLVSADVKRLREEVGWRPRFDLNEGLMRTVEWWQSSRIKASGRAK